MSKMFDEWLLSTRILQRQSFGADPAALDNAAKVEYIRWNHTALIVELSEALDEVDWKPWTTTEEGIRNREAYIGEMVDVLHFAANMLVASGCSDEELTAAYEAKQQKNRDRMASGKYDGKNKCPACKRAYDDPAVGCYRVDTSGAWICTDPGMVFYPEKGENADDAA